MFAGGLKTRQHAPWACAVWRVDPLLTMYPCLAASIRQLNGPKRLLSMPVLASTVRLVSRPFFIYLSSTASSLLSLHVEGARHPRGITLFYAQPIPFHDHFSIIVRIPRVRFGASTF